MTSNEYSVITRHRYSTWKSALQIRTSPLARRLHAQVHRNQRTKGSSAARGRIVYALEPPNNRRIVDQRAMHRVLIVVFGPVPSQIQEEVATARRIDDQCGRHASRREEHAGEFFLLVVVVDVDEVHVRANASYCVVSNGLNLHGLAARGGGAITETGRACPAKVEDVSTGIEPEDLGVDASFAVRVRVSV